MAKVDIIVTAYNIEDYIGHCLESIKNQTYKNYNCIVVNDGTKDHSVQKAAEVIGNDSRFAIYHKKNGGNGDARNYGLKYVTSEYVMLVDGDDFLEPNCLEVLMSHLEKNPVDMLAFGYYQYTLETGHKEETRLYFKDGIYDPRQNKELVAYMNNAPWNKIYKTSLFKDNGIIYPVGYRHADYGCTPKLVAMSKSIQVLNVPLYNYLVDRPNNITTQVDEKIYHINVMTKSVLDFYKEHNLFDTYKEELFYLVTRNNIVSLRKAMRLTDRKFVFKFIDDVFECRKQYFSSPLNKYELVEEKSDDIYISKSKCKLYYLYKGMRNK